MTDDTDGQKIVGHKTFSNGRGGFRHEPLTKAEADAVLAQCEALEAKRRADMPTEQDAIRAMFEAWYRLKELGWKEAMYCPKDGTMFLSIEAGSTGIHDCYYEGKWPTGHWWTPSEGDLWPASPILFKPKPPLGRRVKAAREQ